MKRARFCPYYLLVECILPTLNNLDHMCLMTSNIKSPNAAQSLLLFCNTGIKIILCIASNIVVSVGKHIFQWNN